MRNLLNRLKFRLSQCYGTDALNKFLNIVLIVLCVLSFIPYLGFLSIFAFALCVYILYRTFSRNIYKRRLELDKFLAIKNKRQKKKNFKKLVRRERKEFLYFKCPHCKEYLRVPRGRGKIVVTCRVCKRKIDKKT